MKRNTLLAAIAGAIPFILNGCAPTYENVPIVQKFSQLYYDKRFRELQAGTYCESLETVPETRPLIAEAQQFFGVDETLVTPYISAQLTFYQGHKRLHNIEKNHPRSLFEISPYIEKHINQTVALEKIIDKLQESHRKLDPSKQDLSAFYLLLKTENK